MAKPLTNRGQGIGCSADGPLPAGGGKPVANSLTYSQRKQMKGREQEQQKGLNLKSEVLDPAYAEKLRTDQLNLFEKGVRPKDEEQRPLRGCRNWQRGTIQDPPWTPADI